MARQIPIHRRIKKLLEYISDGLKERDESVRLAFLACIARENTFLFGQHGTAKKLIALRLKSAFEGAKYFEYLVPENANENLLADEIFGPLSQKKLKQDKYERLTEGYLPDSEIAFLDEIWKISPSIQNPLLSLVNKKNPLRTLIASSANLPDKNQGLESLWENFLLRLVINPIQNEDNFLKLLSGKKIEGQIEQSEFAISEKELSQWHEKIEKIRIPREIQEIFIEIRKKLADLEENSSEKGIFYVSDERWTKIVWLLKNSAFLNGRKSIDLLDCQIISHCIWNSEKTIEETKKIVDEIIISRSQNFNDEIAEEIEEIEAQVNNYSNFIEKTFFEENEYGEKIKSPELFGFVRPAHPFPVAMNDGTIAYRILHPEEIRSYDYITPYYISVDFKDYEDGKGAYFTESKQRVEQYDRYKDKYFLTDFRIEDGKAIWRDGDSNREYSFEIKMIPEEYVSGNAEKLFELQSRAEQEYALASRVVVTESQKILKYIKTKERHYKNNLFADTSLCDRILAEAKHTKVRLESATEKFSQAKTAYSIQNQAAEIDSEIE